MSSWCLLTISYIYEYDHLCDWIENGPLFIPKISSFKKKVLDPTEEKKMTELTVTLLSYVISSDYIMKFLAVRTCKTVPTC